MDIDAEPANDKHSEANREEVEKLNNRFQPVTIQSAAVLEAVKARPGNVEMCLDGGATADLDSFCARRRPKSTVGGSRGATGTGIVSMAMSLSVAFARWAFGTGRSHHDRHGRTDMRRGSSVRSDGIVLTMLLCSASGISVTYCCRTRNTTTRSVRIYPWRRIRRSRAPSSGPGTFFAAQFSAGCTTNISGFDLRQAQVRERGFGTLAAAGVSVPFLEPCYSRSERCSWPRACSCGNRRIAPACNRLWPSARSGCD